MLGQMVALKGKGLSLISIFISSGLAIIPFMGIFGFQYAGRDPKLMLAFFYALILGLWGLYDKNRPLKNRWLILFIGYLIFNLWQAPKPYVHYAGLEIKNFYFWKPFAMMLAYLGMFMTMRSKRLDEKVILKVAVWVGFITSLMMIAQTSNLFQWQNAHDEGYQQITGMLGNPLSAGIFVAMLIPIAIYIKRYFFSVLMIIAVLCTSSQTAIWSMALSLLFLLGSWRKNFLILLAVIVLLAGTLGIMCVTSDTLKRKITPRDNGRVEQWINIVDDLREPFITSKAYPYTGFGLGSFQYKYHRKHPGTDRVFYQAHNEYMELLHDTGIMGVLLFMMALITYFRNIKMRCNINKFLLSSVMCSMIAAGAMFGWHLGTIAFYTVCLMGLLDRKRSLS